MVLQPVEIVKDQRALYLCPAQVPGGNFESLVQMKNCGPLPEAFLSVRPPLPARSWPVTHAMKIMIRNLLFALEDLSSRMSLPQVPTLVLAVSSHLLLP